MLDTVVPGPGARPDVLPTDRLLANGVCRPELRPALRRIDDRRNALSVAGLWLATAALVALAVWSGRPVCLRGRVHRHGSGPRPLRRPDPRGRPQALVLDPGGQRLGRDLAHRLPGVHPHLLVPPGPLRPPPRGVRARRAGPGLLRRLPVPAPDPGPPAAPATRWASRAGRTSPPLLRSVDLGPDAPAGPVHPVGPGRAVGRVVGRDRPVVDLPAAVVAALDDPVAGAQPAPRHRRARGHGGRARPPGHHPRRPPVLAGPALAGPVPHGVAPGPPRGHGRAVAQPARIPPGAGAGRLRHRRPGLPGLPGPGGPWPRDRRPGPGPRPADQADGAAGPAAAIRP